MLLLTNQFLALMNKTTIFILKALRRIYKILFPESIQRFDTRITDPNIASKMIYNLLESDNPCMIARFGAFEPATIANYCSITEKKHSALKYIKGEKEAWWWNYRLIHFLNNNAGFFPANPENVERFCKLMLEDAKQVDLLGSWLQDEEQISSIQNKPKVWLDFLIPFLSTNPWSRVLEGKNVLIIHPFAESIISQYKKRHLLFKDSRVLPTFNNIYVIKAVQSLGGINSSFKDWFEALTYMQAEMDKIEYDICLIGCGAYGFPLAAHAKRRGKKAVHLGGALQLLFGIRGKRWENPNLNENYNIASYMNESWTRPREEEKPHLADNVEGGCYW